MTAPGPTSGATPAGERSTSGPSAETTAGAAGPLLPAAVALTALDLLAVGGMGRLFRGGWMVPVLGCALAVHVLSWTARRARLPDWVSVPLVWAVVLLVLCWSVLGQTTWYGLPTAHTFGHFGHDLGSAREAFATMAAPVPPLPGFLLVSGAGAAVICALADWAAFRIHAVLEAVVPAVAVVVFVSLLAPSSMSLAWTACVVAALAVYVAVHETGRRGLFGAAFTGGNGRRPIVTQAGLAMAAVAAVGGAAIGPQLPGARSAALVSVHHPGANGPDQRTTISPLVDIKSRLIDQSDTEMFTVTAKKASYWRLTSLDHFDGEIWSSDEPYSPAGGDLPGGLPATGRTKVSQSYLIDELGSIWLPAAFIPSQLSGAGGSSWDPVSDSLISRAATSDGESYTIVSEEPTFSAAQLEKARESDADRSEVSRDTELPPGVPADVIALARQATAGARTPYEKALALQDYLRSHYTYSLAVQPGHSDSAIQDFLFVTKKGYCEQFAGAYAVMARAVGLPARVAVGFTPGQLVSPDQYEVLGLDAHAWPEVLLGQYGWVPFEPTPGRGIPGAQEYTGVAPQQASLGGGPAAAVTTVPSPAPSTAPAPTVPRRTHLQELNEPHSANTPRSHWPVELIALLALLVVAPLTWAVGIPVGRRARRYRRRRAALGDAERIIVAWEDTHEWLDLAGYARRPGETIIEHARRAAGGTGMSEDSAAALVALAAQASAAAYGPARHSADGAVTARRHATIVERAVIDTTGRWRRITREMNPRPLSRV